MDIQPIAQYIINFGEVDIGRLVGWITAGGTIVSLLVLVWRKAIKPLIEVLSRLDRHFDNEKPTSELLASVSKQTLLITSEAVIKRGYMTTYENEFLNKGLPNYILLGGEEQVAVTVGEALERKVKTSFELNNRETEELQKVEDSPLNHEERSIE